MDLPEYELNKAFVLFLLFLSLFRIAYQRRYQREKNHQDKWWYWDLSDNEKVNEIISTFGDETKDMDMSSYLDWE